MENRLINYWKSGTWFAGTDPNKPALPTTPVTTPKTTEDLSNMNELPSTPATPTPNPNPIAGSTPSNLGANAGSGTINGEAQDPSGTYKPPTPTQPTVPTAPVTSQPSPPATTPTPEPTSDIAPTDSFSGQAEEELEPGYNEWKSGMEGLFDEFEEQKDEKIQSYEELYTHQMDTLNELEGMMKELSTQKNALIAGSADVQNLEIQAAYDANQEQLRIAKLRLEETQRKVMSEREKQLDRKTMNEENMLAVIGGFGSMAGNKMLLDSVEEGEQAIGVLKTEFSFQDQEHTAEVVALTNEYKNDKIKVEQWKQEQIQANYQSLQSFIMNIMEDEEMAYEDKVKSINNAKDQYNNTISQISMDVIDARFELSRNVITRTDQLRQRAEDKADKTRDIKMEDIETARQDLSLLAENYSLENYSSLSNEVKQQIADTEEKAGLPSGFTETAIEKFKADNAGDDLNIRYERDDNGDLNVIAVSKKTGMIVATSTAVGAGKVTASTASNPTEKAFGVGTVGGQCGTFASTVSTASKVGDTWAEKINKVTTRDNPKPGYKLAIPLGVNDPNVDNGHIATVLRFNPESGVASVIESNKGLDEKITMGEYNINELKSQYGEDWGFIEGELKDKYKKLAQEAGFTDQAESEVYGASDYDEGNATPTEEVVEEDLF